MKVEYLVIVKSIVTSKSIKLAKEIEKDYLCHGWNLSALAKTSYDVYYNIESSLELWEALEKKYDT